MTYKEFEKRVSEQFPEIEVNLDCDDYICLFYNGCIVGSIFRYERFMVSTDFADFTLLSSVLQEAVLNLVSVMSSVPLDEREKEEEFYWRLANGNSSRSSISYLNIIEGGEGIAISNKVNSENARTLITIREFEELQDRFQLMVSGYIREEA